MKIKQLFDILSQEEKMEMLQISNKWGENLSTEKWVELNREWMSYRLEKILRENQDKIGYIGLLTKDMFLKFRNAGKISWKEFTELRGF